MWAEARTIKQKALTQVVIISSGAIVVSVNALVPLVALVGHLVFLWMLIVSWVLLLVAIVTTVRYRFLIAADLLIAARQLELPDILTGGVQWQHRKGLKKSLRTWRLLSWGTFLGGLFVLLVFLVLNLCLSKSPQSPPEKPAARPHSYVCLSITQTVPGRHGLPLRAPGGGFPMPTP